MTKRIITLLLAIAMLFSMCALAGCDKGGNGGTTGGNSSGAIGLSAAEEEFFLDMPEELSGTKVKFATWIDHTQTDTATCISGFEETTGMKLELVSVNQNDYISKVTSLIASDQAPDVVVDVYEFPRTLNLLMPLEVETTGLDVTDPFWNQNVVKRYTVGKYCYLVNGAKSSWDMVGGLTYYNKTVLEENGIVTPHELIEQNNWNIDSMWTLMEQMKGACGFSRPGASISVDIWINMFGGGQMAWDVETDTFKTTIKSEQTKKAIDYLMRAKDAGLAEPIDSHDNDITTGAMALQIAGGYGLRKSPGWFYTMDIDDLAFAVLPKINKNDAEYPYTANTRGYGICKGSKNPKGAAYFLRFFLNEANYDMDQIFKNQEAKNLYLELREKQELNKISMTMGIGRVTDPSYTSLTMMKDVLNGTAAQVSVNLEKSYNKCESSVKVANKYVADVIAAQ